MVPEVFFVMSAKHPALSVPVRIDPATFRDFAAFDVLQRQKRWRRPLIFAVIMLAFAVICFTQVGRQEGAALLGAVLIVLGLGLPAIYFAVFFQSVGLQARQLGLSAHKDSYRVDLDDTGVHMRPVGQQDQREAVRTHPWDQVYGAWRTPGALYLYTTATQAYLLPADQIPGGADAAWALLADHLPAEKLHTAR